MHGLCTRAVLGNEAHTATEVPSVRRMPAMIGSGLPSVVRVRVIDVHELVVEGAKGRNDQRRRDWGRRREWGRGLGAR